MIKQNFLGIVPVFKKIKGEIDLCKLDAGLEKSEKDDKNGPIKNTFLKKAEPLSSIIIELD
jgi:hypothetical protein